jgi:hypothetical protein
MHEEQPPKATFWEVESVVLPTGHEVKAGDQAVIVEPTPDYFANSDIKELLRVPMRVLRVEDGRQESTQRPGTFFGLSQVVFLHPKSGRELRLHVSYVRKV